METKPKEKAPDDGPRLGIFDDISNEDYHRGPGISKSGLDLIDRSPSHYIEQKRHPRPPTPAMMLGTALHGLVLEPDKFKQEFVKDPYPGSKAKAAVEARQELAEEGPTIVHTAKGEAGHYEKDDWRTIHRMRGAVMAHPVAGILLDHEQGIAEQSVFWIDKGDGYMHKGTGKLCKCRPDFLNDGHNIAVDLKSTEDASYSGFAKSCGTWRYFVQAAWYMDGLKEAGRKVSAFVFVAVEKSPPYGVGVYVLDKEAIRVGRAMYQRDLEIYAACHKADEWPSYPPEIRDLELPPWGLRGNIS